MAGDPVDMEQRLRTLERQVAELLAKQRERDAARDHEFEVLEGMLASDRALSPSLAD